jgi:hypothetical protein
LFFSIRFSAATVIKVQVKTTHSNKPSIKQNSNRLRGALLPAFAEN